MKTFFYILLTMTLLIGTTLFYVISDNSSMIEFTPESEFVSDTLATESIESDENHSVQEITSSNSAKDNQKRTESRDSDWQGNNSDEVVLEMEINEVVPESSDTSETVSEPDKERIQNEIRTLREDTNRILKQINNNF